MNHYHLTLRNYLKQTNPFVRFLLVGVINTLVGLSTIFILLDLTVNYWISTFIGNGIGAFVSFLLNRRFTFQSRISIQKGAPTFFIVILLCYLGSYLTSNWLVTLITPSFFFISSLTQQDIAVLIGTCLYTLTNYLGQKYFVFIKSDN
jgi:putative flippase GtrA